MALEAYKSHSGELFRYADGSCTMLREGLAAKYKIDANRIVCGAGSDELIALLTMSFASVGDEIIYSAHGFLMYPISAQKVGAVAIKAPEKNLKADIDSLISAITPKTKMIFLANPNNPTGSYLTRAELEKFLNAVPKNILVVLDCAYEEFAQALDYPGGIEFVNRFPNVVMTRTFSKIYGLASLRIGWSYSCAEIAETLNKVRGPFNVGGPAQVAAAAALQDDEFLNASKKHNQKWLEIFFAELGASSKIKAHPSIANFILLDFLSADAGKKANELLLENGIIFREMGSYGLPNTLRATIGTDEENSQILEILKKL
jgi:histidinol-phosphate aminotransferase